MGSKDDEKNCLIFPGPSFARVYVSRTRRKHAYIVMHSHVARHSLVSVRCPVLNTRDQHTPALYSFFHPTEAGRAQEIFILWSWIRSSLRLGEGCPINLSCPPANADLSRLPPSSTPSHAVMLLPRQLTVWPFLSVWAESLLYAKRTLFFHLGKINIAETPLTPR